jgi:hypothetical protein
VEIDQAINSIDDDINEYERREMSEYIKRRIRVIQNDDIKANSNSPDDYYDVTMREEAVDIAKNVIKERSTNIIDPLIDEYAEITKIYRSDIDNDSLTEAQAKKIIEFLESAKNIILPYMENLKDSIKESLDIYFSKSRNPESKEDIEMKNEMKYETEKKKPKKSKKETKQEDTPKTLYEYVETSPDILDEKRNRIDVDIDEIDEIDKNMNKDLNSIMDDASRIIRKVLADIKDEVVEAELDKLGLDIADRLDDKIKLQDRYDNTNKDKIEVINDQVDQALNSIQNKVYEKEYEPLLERYKEFKKLIQKGKKKMSVDQLNDLHNSLTDTKTTIANIKTKIDMESMAYAEGKARKININDFKVGGESKAKSKKEPKPESAPKAKSKAKSKKEPKKATAPFYPYTSVKAFFGKYKQTADKYLGDPTKFTTFGTHLLVKIKNSGNTNDLTEKSLNTKFGDYKKLSEENQKKYFT